MGVIKAAFLTHPGAISAQPESDATFGCGATIALAISALPLTFDSANPLLLMAAAACLLLTLWHPQIFSPFNQTWQLITGLISRLFITCIWFLYILPVGSIMQAQGKDPLHLRFNTTSKTYWQPPTPRTDMQRPL